MKKYAVMIGNIILFIAIYFVILQFVDRLWAGTLMDLHPWFKENVLGVIVLNDLLALPIFYLTFRFILKRNFIKEARFHKMNQFPVTLACGIGLMAGIFTAMFARLPLIQSDELKFYSLFSSLNDSVWYVFLGFLLVGNLFKEVLFRALLFNELRRVLPFVLAVILQGLLYGALFFYFDPPLTMYGFLGAVIFVLLYVWFNSIWAPILAQIFCQGIQYLLWHSPLQINNVAILSSVMIITGVLILYGLYLAWKHQQKPSANPKLTEQEHSV